MENQLATITGEIVKYKIKDYIETKMNFDFFKQKILIYFCKMYNLLNDNTYAAKVDYRGAVASKKSILQYLSDPPFF